jgi:putative addiction module component (TIGR02574 family)
MALTQEEIVNETGKWSPGEAAELVDRLTLKLHQSIAPEIENAWKDETRRRLAESREGKVQAIPGEEVSRKVAGIVGR